MKKLHHLTNIDWAVRSGDCSHCAGRVRVKSVKENIVCDRVLRSDVPERRSRSHYLSEIDPVALTAVCLQCGATTIRKHSSGTVPWRCEWRAKQSNDWKSHYEHPDPHVRNRMKLDHGPYCDIGNHFCDDLHYDHDHKTGKFRGWLCSEHNLGLGKFQDDEKQLQCAIKYLGKVAEDRADRF